VASEPKEIRWYDSDHTFSGTVRKDRQAWLTRLLGVTGAPGPE